MTQDYSAKISSSAIGDILASTKRLGTIIWKERRGMAVVLLVILAFLSTAPFLRSGSLGLLVNELIKTTKTGGASSMLIVALILLGVSIAIVPLFNVLQFYFLKRFWFFLEEKFTILILRKKGGIDIAAHENPKIGDLFNKVRENGTGRIQSFSDRQFFIFQNILEVAISAAILFIAGPWLLAMIVLGTIPELTTEIKYGKEIWGIWGAKAETRRRFWDLNWHFDWIPNIIELKIFQNTGYFVSLVKELLRDFHLEQERVERKKLWLQMGTFLTSQGVTVTAAIYLVFEVIHGKIQVGTLTFFIASIGQFGQSLSGLFANLGRHYQDGLFVRDVFTLLDIKPVIEKPVRGLALPSDKTPKIVFENVSFSYAGSEKSALKNFSLKIRPGEKIALVGANGAGKTTFVKLLARFYDPKRGRILIDGQNLKDIELESWYSQLGIIFQDYSHYNFLVKEAISLGRSSEKQSMEKVRGAARNSEADAFIEEWEKSYKQRLGKQFKDGVEPSIGQWQKLALARTFYRDPRILILDEPTSSIDAESEAKIFEKLENLPKDRTVILISHRFSTVRQANRIVVIKEGTIKELGTHKELLALDGLYARLFRLQAKGYQ